METNNKFGIFTLLLVALTVLAKAHIVEYDDYWKEREASSRKLAEEAYHSNPEEVTAEINDNVNKLVSCKIFLYTL